MSYLAGPAVRHKDGRPEVSRTGVDRILPSRPVQGSWQSPRRALRGPRTVENTEPGHFAARGRSWGQSISVRRFKDSRGCAM